MCGLFSCLQTRILLNQESQLIGKVINHGLSFHRDIVINCSLFQTKMSSAFKPHTRGGGTVRDHASLRIS